MNQGILGFPGRVEGIQGIAGEVRNLVMKANAGTPITKLDVSFDDCLVGNLDGRVRSIGAQALTGNFAVNGVNGLDIGAAVNLSWYYVWVVWNEWQAGLLFSASNTSPQMAGFTFRGLIGEVHYDGSGGLHGFIYYRNGQKRFEFVATTGLPALNSAMGVAHRLGRTPQGLEVRLVCAVAEFGYSVGDEIAQASVLASASSTQFMSVWADLTTVNVVVGGAFTGANTPQIQDRGTPGTLRVATAANWNFKVIASS